VINFRFHLVSLIAVFLALAVGVVIGYGVLGEPTVDTLQGRVDTVEKRADAIRNDNSRLRAEQKRLEQAMQNAAAFAVTNRVSGTLVMPVVARGVDADKVAETVRLARRAGGNVPGVLWLEDKWNLESEEDLATLASLAGVPATSRTAVRDAGLRALANRLSTGPPFGRTDLLSELITAGFVSAGEVDDTQFDLPLYNGRGASTVLVGGTGAKLDWPKTLQPLARALATDGATVIAADDYRAVDGGPGRGDALGAIRGDPTLASEIPTVDDLDVVDGPLTTVLVIGDRRQGNVAHYGFGTGATQTMPQWWHE